MELSDVWKLRFAAPSWQPHKILPPQPGGGWVAFPQLDHRHFSRIKDMFNGVAENAPDTVLSCPKCRWPSPITEYGDGYCPRCGDVPSTLHCPCGKAHSQERTCPMQGERYSNIWVPQEYLRDGKSFMYSPIRIQEEHNSGDAPEIWNRYIGTESPYKGRYEIFAPNLDVSEIEHLRDFFRDEKRHPVEDGTFVYLNGDNIASQKAGRGLFNYVMKQSSPSWQPHKIVPPVRQGYEKMPLESFPLISPRTNANGFVQMMEQKGIHAVECNCGTMIESNDIDYGYHDYEYEDEDTGRWVRSEEGCSDFISDFVCPCNNPQACPFKRTSEHPSLILPDPETVQSRWKGVRHPIVNSDAMKETGDWEQAKVVGALLPNYPLAATHDGRNNWKFMTTLSPDDEAVSSFINSVNDQYAIDPEARVAVHFMPSPQTGKYHSDDCIGHDERPTMGEYLSSLRK